MNMESTPPENTLSLYREEPEDFPVLRAFQQYIDAEQEKARKRMLSLSIFFGCLLTVVIVFFLVLMNNATLRNQLLNDRLVEYAMKERERQSTPQVAFDNTAILALTAKIDEMQKRMEESQKKIEETERARQEAAQQAERRAQEDKEAQAKADSERRSKESLEIERLKSLLQAEREKNAEEAKKRREEELEAYRRKHYPEYYAKQEQKKLAESQQSSGNSITVETIKEADLSDDLDEETEENQGNKSIEKNDPEISNEEEPDPIEALLKDLAKDDTLEDNDDKAISYFTEESDSGKQSKPTKWLIPNE